MIYLLLAEGFEEIEAITPLDILRRLGAEAVTVSVGGEDLVTGSHGITVRADIPIGQAGGDFDMLILPGGMPGTDNLQKSPKVIELIKKAADGGKYIGAICAAPKILGELGLLRGKRVTCFTGYEKYLLGAEITEEPIEADGNIITARGAGVSCAFGFMLGAVLYGQEAARDLMKKMRYV